MIFEYKYIFSSYPIFRQIFYMITTTIRLDIMHLEMTFALLNIFFCLFNLIHEDNLFLFSSKSIEIFFPVETSMIREDTVNSVLKLFSCSMIIFIIKNLPNSSVPIQTEQTNGTHITPMAAISKGIK